MESKAEVGDSIDWTTQASFTFGIWCLARTWWHGAGASGGQDLPAVADGPLPIAEAVRIVEVALSGLAYAHSKDVFIGTSSRATSICATTVG